MARATEHQLARILLERADFPPIGSYGKPPMTVEEIDAHPDADRIWATLAAIAEYIGEERASANQLHDQR